MKNIWVTGVDLGKNSCSLSDLTQAGELCFGVAYVEMAWSALFSNFPFVSSRWRHVAGLFSQPAPLVCDP